LDMAAEEKGEKNLSLHYLVGEARVPWRRLAAVLSTATMRAVAMRAVAM
jgi:hypothetical protein